MIPSAARELAWMDATGLAQRIRSGEVTAREAVEAAIARIEAFNPSLNAVVLRDYERALERADALDRHGEDIPLRGVPFLLKDLGVAVAGRPLYLGNRALREADFRPQWTSELAHRFAALGFVTLGSTNTPEMGAQTTTQPLVYGPARNPWNLERSTSGSSGGAAAAVAAGLVPVAHGNDYLGSIRLPAAWNGVLGMIGSRGRVPLGPSSISRMSREFVIARSVRDLALVLDGVQGYAPGELWTQAPPRYPYVHAIRERRGPLRVGLLHEAPDGELVDPWIASAVTSVGETMAALGHRVEPAHPAALLEDRSRAPQYDRGSEYRRRIRIIAGLLGREVTRDDVEPFLWEMAKRDGESVDSHLAAEIWQQEWAARVTAWWEQDGFDVLVTPTIALPPQTIDELRVPSHDPAGFVRQIARHVAFTAPFNVTGQPALSLPWGPPRSSDSPPPSVQIVGAPGCDDVVLRVAAELEVAAPSVHRPPLEDPIPLQERRERTPG